MKPAKFDGRTPLDEFIISFENCADFNKWSMEDKAAHLRNSLTGNATQLLRDSATSTYKELLEKLERRYGTQLQQEKFRTELRCRRRKKDEPVAELAEAVRNLMMLAYPGDQNSTMATVMARDSFLTALNDPDLEEEVRRWEPKNLDEACRIAKRMEVIHNTVHATSSDQKGHRVRQVNEVVDLADAQDQTVAKERSGRPPWNGRRRWQSENRSAKVVEQVHHLGIKKPNPITAKQNW